MSNILNDTITYQLPPPVVSSFKISNDAAITTTRTVTLNNAVTGTGVTQYIASETPGFAGASWLTYSAAPSFTLSAGEGTKTVYFQVKDSTGNGYLSGIIAVSIGYHHCLALKYDAMKGLLKS
jgi:hypothetical protein